MELIKKQISIDACKSHKNGYFPFIPYNTDALISDTDVTSGITNGAFNYGQFVCDLKHDIPGDNSVSWCTYETLLEKSQNNNVKIGEKWRLSDKYVVNDELSYSIGTILKWDGHKWVDFEIIKYLDIIDKYNTIESILRDGYYCSGVKQIDNKIILRVCDIEKYPDLDCGNKCLGKNKPYDFEPLDINNFEVYDEKTFIPLSGNVVENKFYVLVNNYNTLNNCETWGKSRNLSLNISGDYFTFLQYVNENLINSSGATKNFRITPPCVEIPILLEEEYIVDGVYYPYEYSVSGSNSEIIDLFDYSTNSPIGEYVLNFEAKVDDVKETNKSYISGVSVESKLGNLISPKAISITEDLVGIISGWSYDVTEKSIVNGTIVTNTVTIDKGKIFKAFYYEKIVYGEEYPKVEHSNAYQIIIVKIEPYSEANNTFKICWWEFEEVYGLDETEFICADGEDLEPGLENKRYRNISLLSCISHYVDNPINGDTYYFMARYQNGKIRSGNEEKINEYSEIIKVGLPFIVDEPVNVETYDNELIIYDKVLSIEKTNTDINGDTINMCNITYVIGATSGVQDTGIIYTETLKYNDDEYIDDAWIDGVVQSELYYEKLDYDTNSVEIYNKDYDISGMVRLAQLITFETNNFEKYQYPLITKDGSEHLIFEPKLNADITFNRGNAAGWEKHFKLSECNTMRDLENYGNNVFNI